MNRLLNWLKPFTRRKSAADATDGENKSDSSFGWFGNDQADSNIFVSGSFNNKKSQSKEAAGAVEPNKSTLIDAENDEGFDPYNSGRFNAESR